MSKLRPLIILLALAFVGGIVEAKHIPGRGAPLLDIVQALLMAVAIYWWYSLDKTQRQFKAGPVQNIGIAVATIIALPIYLLRSRGWLRGALATLGALGIFVLMIVVSVGGYMLGRGIAF